MSAMKNPRLQPVRYAPGIVTTSCPTGLEDVLLWRVLHETKNGFFVDVGAGDPNAGSPTRWFYVNGWTGVNIEPHPIMFPIVEKWRPRDVNLNCGIAETSGELIFYKVEMDALRQSWGLSSFDPQSATEASRLGYTVAPMTIKTMTLEEIFEKYCEGRTIDLLKIDVEGYEKSVIRSANFTKHRPRVLCVEATKPLTQIPAFEDWEPILLEAGYIFVLFDGVNNYYVRSESRELLSQFNCGLNTGDRYRVAQQDEYKEPWLYPNDWAVSDF